MCSEENSYLCIDGFFLLTLCSCGKISVDKNQSVELVYKYAGASVDTQLTDEESEQIISIIDGKELYFDNPSCGFDENVSLRVNGKTYCPACDTCCTVKDCSSGQFFTISQAERDIIEEIFESHGGHFPCI